jgi:hypothetical protein
MGCCRNVIQGVLYSFGSNCYSGVLSVLDKAVVCSDEEPKAKNKRKVVTLYEEVKVLITWAGE